MKPFLQKTGNQGGASVLTAFIEDPLYVDKSMSDLDHGGDIYMFASGDFGAAGGYYFRATKKVISGNFAYIIGDVYIYNSTNGEYRPLMYFREDCENHGGTALEGWQFVQIAVSSNMLSLTPS
ncbi:MAG: hypothetical protein IJ123_02250 [Blautia sp.]|nr:hypothetical protein [Blautia sp.]